VRPDLHLATASRTLELSDGRVLHLREWPGRGRPVVLLHGLLDSSLGWAELAARSRRRCVAIDLPGFGLSSAPSRPRLEAYADDVVDGVRRLGVRSFTLVGHSLGGGVAAIVAEKMSREVRSLVLSAPVGFGRLPLAELAAGPIVKELATSLLPHIVSRPPLLAALYSHLITNGVAPTPDLCDRLAVEAGGVAPGVRAALDALAAASRRAGPFTRRHIDYHGPVAAVWGDRDLLVPPTHARGVVRALPQTRVHLWAGVGHHLQRERPLALGALVEAACAAAAPSVVGSNGELRLVA